jgi:hypothetical protein
MDSSIHQHVIACKLRDDMRAATEARAAPQAPPKPPAERRIARRLRFVRRPAVAPVAANWPEGE